MQKLKNLFSNTVFLGILAAIIVIVISQVFNFNQDQISAIVYPIVGLIATLIVGSYIEVKPPPFIANLNTKVAAKSGKKAMHPDTVNIDGTNYPAPQPVLDLLIKTGHERDELRDTVIAYHNHVMQKSANLTASNASINEGAEHWASANLRSLAEMYDTPDYKDFY